MTHVSEMLEAVPAAKEDEDFLEKLVVNPDDLSITLTSSSGEVKKVYFDNQQQLHSIGTEARLELYRRDYDTYTVTKPIFD